MATETCTVGSRAKLKLPVVVQTLHVLLLAKGLGVSALAIVTRGLSGAALAKYHMFVE